MENIDIDKLENFINENREKQMTTQEAFMAVLKMDEDEPKK